MERLFIILAILIFVVAIVAVAVMAARSRREPLRMGSEFDSEDADLLIGPIGPHRSPIDRAAQVLDQSPAEPPLRDWLLLDLEASELEPIKALDRTERGEPARRDPRGSAP